MAGKERLTRKELIEPIHQLAITSLPEKVEVLRGALVRNAIIGEL